MGRVVSAVGTVVGGGLEVVGAAGGVFTALRMPGLVRRQHGALRRLFEIADAIVAPAPWVRDLLLANGVAGERIVLSRHGVTPTAFAASKRRADRSRLALAHLGRVDAAKGTRLLLDAMGKCPEAPIELDIYGVSQGDGSRSLLERLEAQGRSDARVRFLPPVPHDRVVATLGAYDAVAVPSQGLETGPLVVLEAFAAGVPVIGSDLGGIAEKIRHGVDGLLVRPFDSPARWAEVLSRAAADLPALRALGPNVRQPRSTEAVADEMLTVYERVTDGRCSSPRHDDGVRRRPQGARACTSRYTNPAVYPPLLHSIGLLADAGCDVRLVGLDTMNRDLAIRVSRRRDGDDCYPPKPQGGVRR